MGAANPGDPSVGFMTSFPDDDLDDLDYYPQRGDFIEWFHTANDGTSDRLWFMFALDEHWNSFDNLVGYAAGIEDSNEQMVLVDLESGVIDSQSYPSQSPLLDYMNSEYGEVNMEDVFGRHRIEWPRYDFKDLVYTYDIVDFSEGDPYSVVQNVGEVSGVDNWYPDNRGVGWRGEWMVKDGSQSVVVDGLNAEIDVGQFVYTGTKYSVEDQTGYEVMDMAWDGTHIWAANWGGQVVQIDPDSGLTGTSFNTSSVVSDSSHSGITWVGNAFWLLDYDNLYTGDVWLHEFDSSGSYTGTTYNISSYMGSARRLASDSQHIWVAPEGGGPAYEFDLSGNFVSETADFSNDSPVGTVSGLTFDGTAFWVPYEGTVYRFDTDGFYLDEQFDISGQTEDSYGILFLDGEDAFWIGESFADLQYLYEFAYGMQS